MLPQKLGLDVLVENGTGRLVTVEINGENSGYTGLTALGEDLCDRVVGVFGRALRGKKVLVNPLFTEFYFSEGALGKLRREFDATLVFCPVLNSPVTRQEFEEEFGASLEGFDALVGFGGYISNSGLDYKMINSPAVQVVTEDKLLQCRILADVPGLNMPRAWFLDDEIHVAVLAELQQQYGSLVWKPRHGSQGSGIMIITEKNAKDVFFQQLAKGLSTRIPGLFGSMNTRNEGVPDPDPGVAQQQSRPAGEWKIVTYGTPDIQESAASLYATKPDEAKRIARERLQAHGVIVQQFVETQPVIRTDSGQSHFASARLIWFDCYIGGYWRLSANPVSDNDPLNAVVNFSRTGLSQRFTPEEARMFRRYAEAVVPLVLGRLSAYEGRAEDYRLIEEIAFKETFLLSQPERHLSVALSRIIK